MEDKRSAAEIAADGVVAWLSVSLWQNPRTLWLAYLPAKDGEYGRLGVLEDGADLPPGWLRASDQRIPTDRTVPQLGAWVWSIVEKLPLSPPQRAA